MNDKRMDCACQTEGGYVVGLCGAHSNYMTKQLKEQEAAINLRFNCSATPMILCCPLCGARHVDRGDFATKLHHTHACQECGFVWRPALVNTVGVQFLQGFKDE